MKRKTPSYTQKAGKKSTTKKTSTKRSSQKLPGAWSPTGSEIKAIDIPQGDYSFRVPTNTNIILLNGIQTGAAFFNRVGSRIEMKNLHIRGALRPSATNGENTSARMIILYDRQPTGALPVITDILLSRDQAGATTTTGHSEINLDNRDRFVILRDLMWYLPSSTNTAGVLTNGPNFPGDDEKFDVNVFIKLKELGTHFKSSTNPTAIGDIATGALYALFISEANDGTWSAKVSFRLRFDDK